MKPNIIYIYADDLGRGMLSCYGQSKFSTPNIDRIASQGMRFMRAYGASICAPARASLLTGQHDAHAGRWTFNRAGIYDHLTRGSLDLDQVYEVVNNTGIRPRRDGLFLASALRDAGYFTGQIGKLEWGFSTSDEEIRMHGWMYHYGYYDHLQCHGYYPPYLFENGDRIDIPGNTRDDFGAGAYGSFPEGRIDHDSNGRAVHSQDLYDARIVEFLNTHKDEPFFLYHPSQLPHGPAYFPDVYPEIVADSDLNPAEKEFASMVIRLDKTVGVILAEVERLGLDDRTIIMFASDNGHQLYYEVEGRTRCDKDLVGNVLDNVTSKFYSDTCGDIYDGNDGMAGLKTTNWEGGVRVPFLVRWPGVVPAGVVSEHLIANYDTLATLAQIAGNPAPADATDGISFLPALEGESDAPEHDYIVYASQFGPCLVTRDGWKLRLFLNLAEANSFGLFGVWLSELGSAVQYQLYYLPDDYREERNVADQHPDLLVKLRGSLLKECDGNFIHGTPQAHFAMCNIDSA